MILLTGSTGYIGSAFAKELTARNMPWVTVGHERCLDYLTHNVKIGMVINAAAFIPDESVSLCDSHQRETIEGNVILPTMLSRACMEQDISIAHISTGCLWYDGKEHREDDPPQRDFNGHCGFYIGTKVMAERLVRKNPKHYIWRVRLPFDEQDSPRNYLSKLATFPEVWDHTNSVSHRGDFVKACLDLVQLKAAYGTYNCMNPGSLRSVDVVEQLIAKGIRKGWPKIVSGKPGDSKVSVDKLLSAGVKIRPVEEALTEALNNWKSA